MSPNQREREYERRRYQKWQDKQQLAARRRARQRRLALNIGAAVAAVAVVAVVLTVLLLTNRNSGSPTPAAVSPSVSSPAVSPSTSAGPSAKAAPNPCPKPPANVSSPKSWKTAPPKTDAAGKSFQVTLKTSCGDIGLTLDGAKAPQAVASTVFLARNAFYNDTPCHRLTTEGIFVLQCGDPTGTGGGGPGFSYGPVENAPANNDYPAGTVAMARQGGNGSSMGSQFFLVYQDSQIPADNAGGYTVLGHITSGLDVVKKIAQGGAASGSDGAPQRAVSIVAASVK